MIKKNKKIVDFGEIYVDLDKDQEAMVDFIESLLVSRTKSIEVIKQKER